MIKAFRLEDAVLQLTAKDLTEASKRNEPIWIALSTGTQCIAGLSMEAITKHIDLSAVMVFYDMDNIDDYILQRPWVAGLIDEL